MPPTPSDLASRKGVKEGRKDVAVVSAVSRPASLLHPQFGDLGAAFCLLKYCDVVQMYTWSILDRGVLAGDPKKGSSSHDGRSVVSVVAESHSAGDLQRPDSRCWSVNLASPHITTGRTELWDVDGISGIQKSDRLGLAF